MYFDANVLSGGLTPALKKASDIFYVNFLSKTIA
jgi:hypothetical protein